jgi:predicted phosphoadenosine phosphosulfate sulfurtransferase
MPRYRMQVPTEQDVYALALQRIRRTFELYDHVSVSFSGGKDSTAVLNLTLEVAREIGYGPVDVVFWDEECVDPETEAYVRRTMARPDVNLRWLCLPITHRNGCSREFPYWYPWDPTCPELWVRPLPPEGITHLDGYEHQTIPNAAPLLYRPQSTWGSVAQILGIRADESLTRRRALKWRREDNWINALPFARWIGVSKPIYDWKVQDVWRYPKQFGLDYNHSYDLMAMAGLTPHAQRIAPPFGEQPILGLWRWQTLWPEMWDKMCVRVPGAATAARYARTELYGLGGKNPVPPAGMDWQEGVEYFLRQHPQHVRAHTAERLKIFFRGHARACADKPIPEIEPCETCGVSWSYMLAVAMKGDLKERNDPTMRIKNPDWKRAYDQRTVPARG